MLLSAFEKSVNPTILKRGDAYFNENRVHDLENNGTEWQANVEGTEDYFVEITIKKNKVSSWDCDCPYDDEAVCKHVVAVLLAIRDENKPPNEAKVVDKKKTSQHAAFDKLLKATSDADVRKFILLYSRHNQEFKDSFTRFITLADPESNKEKYIVVIESAIKSVKGRHNYIDYKDLTKLVRLLRDLDTESKKALLDKDYLKTMYISMAVFETITPVVTHVFDENSRLVERVMEALHNLSVLLEKVLAPELKNQLYEYLLAAIKQTADGNEMIMEALMGIIQPALTSPNREQAYLMLLEELTNTAQSEHAEYSFIKDRIAFLQSRGKDADAKQLIFANLRFPQFRELGVRDAMARNDFSYAKELLLEGMKLLNGGYWGVRLDWTILQLQIAELENNILDTRLYAGKLLRSHHMGIEVFRKWKSTFSFKEWQRAFDDLTSAIKNSKYVPSQETYLDIMAEEERWKIIMDFMQSAWDASLVLRTIKKLPLEYHQQATVFAETAINRHADRANSRSDYKHIVSLLKEFKQFDLPTATIIIEKYRNRYKQRPALLDEMKKL